MIQLTGIRSHSQPKIPTLVESSQLAFVELCRVASKEAIGLYDIMALHLLYSLTANFADLPDMALQQDVVRLTKQDSEFSITIKERASAELQALLERCQTLSLNYVGRVPPAFFYPVI